MAEEPNQQPSDLDLDLDLDLENVELATVPGALPPIDDTSPYLPRAAEKPAAETFSDLPPPKDHDQLRIATAAMVEQELSLKESAIQHGVDPETLRVWYRTYINFVGKDSVAANPSDYREKVEIDRRASSRFNRNWAELMRRAEAERPELSPLWQKLMKSPFTGWMFRGETVDKVAVSGAVAVIAFSVLAIKVATSHRGADTIETEKPPAVEQDADPDSLSKEEQNAIVIRVITALNEFAKLETWKERLRYVRSPARVAPLMEAYYSTHPDGQLKQLVVNPEFSFIKRSDGDFMFIQATLTREGSPPAPMVFLVEVADGEPEFLFDWEILVNYEPVSWEEFTAAKSTKPSAFRVKVSRGDYFNAPFMDADKFASFKIKLLNREKDAFAFAPKNSLLAAKIDRYISKELAGNRAMILNLRYPDGATHDDVLQIEDIVSDGWLGKSPKMTPP